jgi:hypothetical protein
VKKCRVGIVVSRRPGEHAATPATCRWYWFTLTTIEPKTASHAGTVLAIYQAGIGAGAVVRSGAAWRLYVPAKKILWTSRTA